MSAVYVILIIVAFFLLLSLIPINVIADFSYNYGDNSLFLKILFFEMKLYPQEKKDKKKNKKKDESPEEEKDEDKKIEKKKEKYSVNDMWYIFQSLKDNVLGLLNYIITKSLIIKDIRILADLGMGDPMYTGLLCGGVNAAVYGMLGAADAKMRLKNHDVKLNFDFDNMKIAAGVHTVIYTRLVYVYCIAFKAAVIFIKFKKALKEVKKYE